MPALHPLFESAGYALGFLAYRRARGTSGDVVTEDQRWSVIAAASIGGFFGSRVLGLLAEYPRISLSISQVFTPTGGKTIVGGLLGGYLGVELVKWIQGIRTRTGDLFAVPLCIGIGVGRIGCLLAGLSDDTYGKPTTLPWGVNFGDGVARHPTQAYEIVFLSMLAGLLTYLGRRPHENGALFRWFLLSYLAWRLLIDFLKPATLWAGMSAIQWACVAGILLLFADWKGRRYSRGRIDG